MTDKNLQQQKQEIADHLAAITSITSGLAQEGQTADANLLLEAAIAELVRARSSLLLEEITK